MHGTMSLREALLDDEAPASDAHAGAEKEGGGSAITASQDQEAPSRTDDGQS